VREAVRPWREEPIAVGEALETLAEYGLWALLTPVVFWLVRRFPAERGAWAGRLAAQVAVGVGVALAIEVVTRGVLEPLLVGPPPGGRAWTFTGMAGGLWFLDELVIYLALLAAGYARAALFQVQERRAEAERLLADRARLEAQLAEARLAALRTQFHPHFLFNTLHAVSALVERDPAGVRTLVARLSSLLRRVLEADDGAQEIPLRDEADFLRDYLDVQRVRFQGRLEVEEDYGPGTLDALVPPLVLQPLVENAVGHGVGRLEEGVGTIRVSARREAAAGGDRLVLAVEDNGPGLDAEPRPGGAGRSTGVGLATTRARLDALYGDAAALALAPRPGGGVRAEVALPFRAAAPAAAGDGAAGAVRVAPGA
jgi:signal transduction histidine kinase